MFLIAVSFICHSPFYIKEAEQTQIIRPLKFAEFTIKYCIFTYYFLSLLNYGVNCYNVFFLNKNT